MHFGELRAMLHSGELPPLFATLPEDQYGYAMRMVGESLAARAARMRLAQWLVYVEDPLSYNTLMRVDPALYPLLRWFACDVASEAMRMHGNGDPRSLRAIKVGRLYVLGKASQEDLRQAREDAFEAADTAAASDAAYDDAHAASEAAAWAASEAAADAAEAAAHAAYDDAAYADAARAADAAYAFAYAYAAASDADWSTHYRKHKTLLTNWRRAYLLRWIEEGAWWEVSS